MTNASREGEDWTASVDGEGPAEGQPEDVGTSRAVATTDGGHNVFYVDALARLSAAPRLVVTFEAVPAVVVAPADGPVDVELPSSRHPLISNDRERRGPASRGFPADMGSSVVVRGESVQVDPGPLKGGPFPSH